MQHLNQYIDPSNETGADDTPAKIATAGPGELLMSAGFLTGQNVRESFQNLREELTGRTTDQFRSNLNSKKSMDILPEQLQNIFARENGLVTPQINLPIQRAHQPLLKRNVFDIIDFLLLLKN